MRYTLTTTPIKVSDGAATITSIFSVSIIYIGSVSFGNSITLGSEPYQHTGTEEVWAVAFAAPSSTIEVTGFSLDSVMEDDGTDVYSKNDPRNLRVSGYIKESISDVIDVVAANGITAITDSTMLIQGSIVGESIISKIPQIVAGTSGQPLRLVGNDNTKLVTFSSGNGLALDNGRSFTLGFQDVLKLIFVGSKWLEESRKNNL